MRIGPIAAIAVLICAPIVVIGGETFELQWEKTGKTFGPFECREGEEIVIGKATFTIVNVKKKEEKVESDVGARRDPEAEKAALAAAEEWLKLIDTGKYEDSWGEIADYLKGTVPKDEFLASLKTVRSTLGKVISRAAKSMKYADSMPSAPDGKYIIIHYETKLEHKQSAVETVIPMLGKDGKWRVSGYDIR